MILVDPPWVRVGDQVACGAVLTAVLWILRSGGQWRLLPEPLGELALRVQAALPWCSHGVLEAVHKGCIHLPDLRTVFIDATVIRAHPGAAGGRVGDEALGRSRGGLSTKAQAITDALGNPFLDVALTGGPASDIGQAEVLGELTPEGAEAPAGDKGYDSGQFIAASQARGMEAVIPPRAHRAETRLCNGFVAKKRHLMECCFNKIKPYRRIFSRFEKLASH